MMVIINKDYVSYWRKTCIGATWYNKAEQLSHQRCLCHAGMAPT